MHAINRQRLLFIVTLDIVLLPVFNIFGLSFKFFFIPLFYNLLLSWKNVNTIKVLILFIVLIFSIFIGALYQYFSFNVTSLNYTIFLCTSIFLGYVGYSFGYNNRPLFLDNLIYIAIAYSLINITMVLSPEFGYVVDNFYNVIYKEWHPVRAHGTFSNPNVSALMVNLLLVMTFLAKRFEMLKSKSNFIILVQFLVSFAALLIFSSITHFILFFIVVLFYIHLIIKKSLGRKAITLGVVLCLVTLFQLTTPSKLAKKNNFETESIYNALNKIIYIKKEIHNVINPSRDYVRFANIQHSRAFKFKKALEAFRYSPIIGSGFERPIDGPLFDLKIGYHNDWSYILVAGGLISIFTLFLIVFKIWWVHPILIVLFFIPGMTHTLMFTMQIFCLYGIIWGIINHAKHNRSRISIAN